MGCGCSSASSAAATDENGPLQQKLRMAVQEAKRRTTGDPSTRGTSGSRTGIPRRHKPSFNGMLMHFGSMRPGFLKLKALFQSLEPDPKTHTVSLETLHAKAHADLHLGASELLVEVLKLCRQEGKKRVTEDDFIIVWTILAFMEPSSTMHHPEIKSALDILEKAFTYFDSSTDGMLERGELVAALSSGTRRVATLQDKGKKGSVKRRHKGAADMLFDVLDLDNSGTITFQEFLLGIVQIVLSDEMTEEDEEMAEFHKGN